MLITELEASPAKMGLVEVTFIMKDHLLFFLDPLVAGILSEVVPNWDGRTSLAVQWLRIHTSTAGATGLIPGWGTKILHAKKKKKRQKTNWDGEPQEYLKQFLKWTLMKPTKGFIGHYKIHALCRTNCNLPLSVTNCMRICTMSYIIICR